MTRIVQFDELLAKRVDAGIEVEVAELTQSVGEMITTSDGLMDLVQKVRIDVAFGQAETPTLYESIYRRLDPPGGFPGRSFDIGENTLQANVVFFEKLEGGEVQFGTMQKGTPAQGRLATYAAGFQWTEDMEVWDSTWSFELVNQAFGRSYNHFLNHIHLSAITLYDHDGNGSPSYPSSNKTAASAIGSTLEEKTLNTFQDAYRHALSDIPQRRWSVLLASELDRFQIEAALLEPVKDVQGNTKPRVPVSTIIYYDGADIEMGTETYNYPGVVQGKVYAIFPKQKMLELIEHDLKIDSGNADISRLTEAQVVGRTRRGLYGAIEESVEEITLPS